MSLLPAYSQPFSPSPPLSPIPRPPSRSERLLRHTLRRDDIALAHPTPPRHQRRHSTPSKRPPHDIDRDPDNTRPSLFSRNSVTPTTSPRLPRGVYGGNPQGYSHSRPSSPSPSTRRHHRDHNEHPTLVPALTPHEQVLRARLERVLHAGRGVVRAESRERTRQQGRPRSSQSASDESDEAWPWGDASSQYPTSTPKQHRQQHQQHQRSRSKTDPTPPSPTTPPRSRSRSKSHSHSPPHSHSHLHTARDHHQQHYKLQQDQQEPLTPPPTPPSPSTSLHAHLLLSPAHPSAALHAPFNARTASARCRQMEGYVSFAAVEGLGEPPAGGEDDDPAPCGQGGAEDGKGRIFGRLWRVLGGEMVGR